MKDDLREKFRQSWLSDFGDSAPKEAEQLQTFSKQYGDNQRMQKVSA